MTRSGRARKPYDWAKNFPETAHFQKDDVKTSNGSWLKPCYFDEESMVDKLSEGMCYHESYFGENVDEVELNKGNELARI